MVSLTPPLVYVISSGLSEVLLLPCLVHYCVGKSLSSLTLGSVQCLERNILCPMFSLCILRERRCLRSRMATKRCLPFIEYHCKCSLGYNMALHAQVVFIHHLLRDVCARLALKSCIHGWWASGLIMLVRYVLIILLSHFFALSHVLGCISPCLYLSLCDAIHGGARSNVSSISLRKNIATNIATIVCHSPDSAIHLHKFVMANAFAKICHEFLIIIVSLCKYIVLQYDLDTFACAHVAQ